MVAAPVLELVQLEAVVPWASAVVQLVVVISLYVQVAVQLTVDPAATELGEQAADTAVRVAAGGALLVTVSTKGVAVTVPIAAVMLLLPAATPVTTPEALLIVATLVVALVQDPATLLY